MSKKEKTTSKYLNSIEDKEHKKNKKIEVDQVFFVSRLNKPAKYTENSNFFSYLIYRIGKDDAAGLAAQMTYHFVLALFPMLIFLLTLLGQFITIDANQINQKVSQYVPDQETASIVGGIVKDISDTASGGILSVGLILAIWSASNGMSAIINSFNVAYDVEDSRNGVVVKLLSILYTLVLGAVFVVAVVLITLGPVINKFLFGPLGIDNQIEWIFNLVRIVIPLIIIFIIFTVLYSVAPNVKTKLRSVIPGAIFTSIIWLLGSFAFGYYISNFSNYSKTYGSLAGIIILFLWLYITSFIIIIGAEINAIIHQRKVIAGHTYEDSKDVDISNEDDTYNINHQSKEEHHTSD
ncbi:MAG: YihY/virulence factor BrkB family protein [Staphylococcus epidermidis]|nr:YihY/virulence factor BrkB family protein [Staphylococcus epidermidis]